MRRLLLVLLLAAPGLANAAAAPPPAGRIAVVAPVKLRGPVRDASATITKNSNPSPHAPTATAALSPAPWAAPARPITPADGGECRMACSQTYYFCRAGETPDDCAPKWSQCVSACDSPNLDLRVATTP
ncbi:MAG: hypothetical protein ACHP84_12230 [Caulobacterales bacterium]